MARRKPPYVLIVDEKDIDEAKAYINGRIGSNRFFRVSGYHSRMNKISKVERVAMSIVVAPKNYAHILAGAKNKQRAQKMRERGEVSVVITAKIPGWIVMKLDEIAKNMGISRNKLIEKIFIEYINSYNGVEQ